MARPDLACALASLLVSAGGTSPRMRSPRSARPSAPAGVRVVAYNANHPSQSGGHVDEDGPRAIDARRNVALVLYGGLYQGIAQFVMFNRIFPRMFGDGTDVTTVASKVLFDNAFVSPFLCPPLAYLVKSAVFRFTLEEASARYVRSYFRTSWGKL